MLSGRFPDGGAPCPHGCLIDTPAVRGAWAALAHQACAREIRDLVATDPLRAAVLLRRYEKLYARLAAEEHDEAKPWMLRGRLFHQALSEAIWATSIGSAARELGDAVPRLRGSLAEAARAARTRLADQGRFTSNYTAWLNAAGAVCSGEESWLVDEHGVYAHIREAVHDDGWEWEGSTYYHAFVLRAYLLALQAVRQSEPTPDDVVDRLERMADAFGAVTTSGGLVAALNDGPYERVETQREYDELRRLLRTALPSRTVRTEAQKPVVVFPDAGYAVLRGNGVHAILDFGPHGGAHGHRDKLSLYLYGATQPWQPDPGQVPYGHRHWRDYYASTAAHPTFTVDGAEQAPCSGRLESADARGVVAVCDSAYPGVTARRGVRLDGETLVDEVVVTSERPARLALQLRPDVPLTLRGGTTRWGVGAQTLIGRHECGDPAAVLTAVPGPGPADDPQRVRTHVEWAAEAAVEATFRSTYRVEKGDV
ncbi:MAG: alginate lyase family protein [Stackebrandtia sp.]